MIKFSTADLHVRDREYAWHQFATQQLKMSHEFRAANPSKYNIDFSAGPLDVMKVAHYQCSPCRVIRNSSDVLSDCLDDVSIVAKISGRTLFEQESQDQWLSAQSLLLLDHSKPMHVVYEEEASIVKFTIPRRVLESRLGALDRFVVRQFNPASPITRLVMSYLSNVPDCLNISDPSRSRSLAEHAIDLICLGLSDVQTSDVSTSRMTALGRLKVAIKLQLNNPDLTPELACRLAGISVRYGNALLSQEGTSLERYIVSQRLERCRRILIEGSQAHRSVSDIAMAWGFSDPSHFGRRFKSIYGLPPNEYRRQFMERKYRN